MKKDRSSLIKYGGRLYEPDELRDHLADKKKWAELAARRKHAFQLGLPQPRNDRKRPADPTVTRLMRTIAECRELERRTWAKLNNYFATGRTIVRERLYENADHH